MISNTIQLGMIQQMRNFTAGSRRRVHTNGAAITASSDPGQKVIGKPARWYPNGAPCACWPSVTLFIMLWPIAIL